MDTAPGSAQGLSDRSKRNTAHLFTVGYEFIVNSQNRRLVVQGTRIAPGYAGAHLSSVALATFGADAFSGACDLLTITEEGTCQIEFLL